jgi:hypothetical protein
VTKLKESYPPLGHWVYESDRIGDRWDDHITNGPQADSRQKRYPLMKLDASMLVHDVGPNDSVILMEGSRLVGLTFRNFCGDPRVVHWVDDVIRECVGAKRSVRVSQLVAKNCYCV